MSCVTPMFVLRKEDTTCFWSTFTSISRHDLMIVRDSVSSSDLKSVFVGPPDGHECNKTKSGGWMQSGGGGGVGTASAISADAICPCYSKGEAMCLQLFVLRQKAFANFLPHSGPLLPGSGVSPSLKRM